MEKKFFERISFLYAYYFIVIYCSLQCKEVISITFKICPKTLPKDMRCIPGGEYIIGSNSKKWKEENPEHFVILSTFLLDTYEVTTAEYQTCVRKKICSEAHSNYKHTRGDLQPQLKVSWYQARDYCKSQKKRLPTEAEFEAASRGPEGDMYPWNNEKADCSKTVIFTKMGRGCTLQFSKIGSTQPVGSRPKWRFGLYDIGGECP